MKKIILLMILILMTSGCAKSSKQSVNDISQQCAYREEQDCQMLCEQKVRDALEEAKAKAAEEEPPEHIIDLNESKCLKSAVTNVDMMRCGYKAVDEWLAEIDRNMAELKRILPPEKYSLILESQEKWKKYYNSETKSIYKLIFNKGGTFYFTVAIAEDISLVRDRSMLLKHYINLYSEMY